MASTYSDLKFELIGTGDQSGTWGTTTNDNIGTAIEQAITGFGNPIFTTDANLTISLTNTVALQTARALVLNATSSGSLTATRELVVPTIEKQYIVQNNTTGAQSITVKTTAGTGITVPNGRKAHLYVDGTNVIQMFDFVDINGGTVDNAVIGGTTAVAGTFTTATATTGNITTVNATTVDTTNVEVTNIKAKDGTASATIADSTGVMTIGSSVLTTTDINGGTVDNTVIGGATTAAGSFTTLNATVLTATADSSFTSTGAVIVSKGTTGQRPGSPVSGMFRFNTTTAEFEGYNGTAFASVGGAALSNDTTTASSLFPLFASATTGTASSLFTSNAKLLYKPSTGEFQASVPVASNGIFVNSQTVAASYTIAVGFSAMSSGPVTIASGQAVTVSSGSRWVVV